MIPIRYKDKNMQAMFTAALQLAANQNSELYKDGAPRRGAGLRCAFWDGFEGKQSAHVVPGTLSQATYMAGKEFAQQKVLDNDKLPPTLDSGE